MKNERIKSRDAGCKLSAIASLISQLAKALSLTLPCLLALTPPSTGQTNADSSALRRRGDMASKPATWRTEFGKGHRLYVRKFTRNEYFLDEDGVFYPTDNWYRSGPSDCIYYLAVELSLREAEGGQENTRTEFFPFCLMKIDWPDHVVSQITQFRIGFHQAAKELDSRLAVCLLFQSLPAHPRGNDFDFLERPKDRQRSTRLGAVIRACEGFYPDPLVGLRFLGPRYWEVNWYGRGDCCFFYYESTLEQIVRGLGLSRLARIILSYEKDGGPYGALLNPFPYPLDLPPWYDQVACGLDEVYIYDLIALFEQPDKLLKSPPVHTMYAGWELAHQMQSKGFKEQLQEVRWDGRQFQVVIDIGPNRYHFVRRHERHWELFSRSTRKPAEVPQPGKKPLGQVGPEPSHTVNLSPDEPAPGENLPLPRPTVFTCESVVGTNFSTGSSLLLLPSAGQRGSLGSADSGLLRSGLAAVLLLISLVGLALCQLFVTKTRRTRNLTLTAPP